MRKLLIVLFLFSLVSCGKLKREIEYIKEAKASVGDSEWLNYDVDVITDLSDGGSNIYSFSVISFLGKEEPFYVIIIDEIQRFEMIKEKEALVVNEWTRELCRFTPNEDNSNWYDQISFEAANQLEYLSFYTLPFPKQLAFPSLIPFITKTTDTLVQSIPYRKYTALHSERKVWNEETQEFDIPLQYSSIIWLNLNTKQLDSVSVFQVTDNNFGASQHYHIHGLNHDDKSEYINSIFDFGSPKYEGFSKHSEDFPPYSRTGGSNEDFDEELLQFPFVNLGHDTTTLSQTEGWVLLDLWQFGCPPCYQGIKELQHERDSLGSSILERESITIIAANAKSDNLDLIKEVSEKYGCPDILLTGKGIMSKLVLVDHAFPSYYLISPEKKIVWRSNFLGDYSELLEAKSNYEKQQQN